MNALNESVRQMNLLYIEFPEFFVWHNDERQWRQRKKFDVIGRLVSVSPLEGDRYYLRFSLMSVRASTSFDSLKKVNGFKVETFRQAVEKLGLLSGDFVITKCLEEVVLFQMPSSLRRLFATLLILCDIGNPRELWDTYIKYTCEDILRTGLYEFGEAENLPIEIVVDVLESMGKHIDEYSLVDYNLGSCFIDKEPKDIIVEYNLGPNEPDLLCIPNLNVEQHHALDIIITNVGAIYFVYGLGGIGKTFLYRCLLAAVWSKKLIAFVTLTSRIATSILPGRRTAHSRFKLPIDGEDKFVCNIGKQSAITRLLREVRLILWDEASMANRKIIENLDVTLRDITNGDLLFGGKVIVFGGDFCQTLPIVKGGNKEDLIQASLVKSSLIWLNVIQLHLTQEYAG